MAKALRLRVPLVGGLELLDEFAEEPRVLAVAGRGVVLDEVAAGGAEHFPHGRGREIDGFGHKIFAAQKGEEFLGRTEKALVKRVDEEGLVLQVAADDEVAGEGDRLEHEAE